MNLIVKDNATLYFKTSETLTFSCGYEPDTKQVDVQQGGGYTVARVRGINADDLGRTLSLNIQINGSSGWYIEYSPMTYCYQVLNGGSDDVKLQNVCKALYLYHRAVWDYL